MTAFLAPASVAGGSYLAAAAPPIGTTSVSSNLVAAYSVRGAVSASITATYAVRSSMSDDLVATYVVRSAVSSDMAANYAVRGAVSANLSASYSIAGALPSSVSSNLVVNYMILGPTNICADSNIWRGHAEKPKAYTHGATTITVPSGFTLRGGKPTADMDPDDAVLYGVSVVDLLAVRPNVSVTDVALITAGVAPYPNTAPLNNGDVLIAFLVGTGLFEDDENFCTFRITLSNAERLDRTIYFRKVTK